MSLRILIADHEFVSGFDLCDTCEEAGYEVVGPHAGISSVMLACQMTKPDLAILDIELVDGLSYELAQKLLDDNVPVIVHAASVQVDELAARLPGALTVPRPCPPADLLHAVNRVLTPA